jgi:hypothetical protein
MTRRTREFPIGALIIASPPTVRTDVRGVVVERSGDYTITLRCRDIDIAVDVEDCKLVVISDGVRSM